MFRGSTEAADHREAANHRAHTDSQRLLFEKLKKTILCELYDPAVQVMPGSRRLLSLTA
jgi:hypothetical protein